LRGGSRAIGVVSISRLAGLTADFEPLVAPSLPGCAPLSGFVARAEPALARAYAGGRGHGGTRSSRPPGATAGMAGGQQVAQPWPPWLGAAGMGADMPGGAHCTGTPVGWGHGLWSSWRGRRGRLAACAHAGSWPSCEAGLQTPRGRCTLYHHVVSSGACLRQPPTAMLGRHRYP
jgi:hypothetical protein